MNANGHPQNRLKELLSPSLHFFLANLRWLLWYFLGMYIFWMVGFEAVYGSPTPFYALFAPVVETRRQAMAVALLAAAVLLMTTMLWRQRLPLSRPWFAAAAAAGALAFAACAYADLLPGAIGVWNAVKWHLPAAAVLLAGTAAFKRLRISLDADSLDPAQVRRVLAALWLFALLFACAIAMLRGGLEGISQAYARHTHEYIGDIGVGGSIAGLFGDYPRYHPYLSMHAKVHPPGPIALLWLMSHLVTRGPLALSIATAAVGSLSVFPMYAWAKSLSDRRTGFAAAFIFALMPGIVLFTATSANILFMPFTLTTLYLFDTGMQRRSLVRAFAAGLLYGVMSILSFSLIAVGVYFAVRGIQRLFQPTGLRRTTAFAAVMVIGVAAFHGALWTATGFDVVETFQLAKSQFDADQRHMDMVTPRYPAWMFRILNPLTWLYFGGIPVTVLLASALFLRRGLVRKEALAMLVTLAGLNLLYLARGEGERSAMYVYPFMLLPAALELVEREKEKRRFLLPAALAFLAFQTWLTETLFYTFW